MKTRKFFTCFIMSIFFFAWIALKVSDSYAEDKPQKTYAGSLACQPCHETEYKNFQQYAKKAGSFSSVMIMKKGLTPSELSGCYECHTTGYGESGGFVSEKETPHLKNAGCEVCHGPGSLHVQTQDPLQIKGSLTIKDCEKCHINEKVKAFNYKPMIHGGAH
ncbi:Cytochrome c family protein [Desulfonema limicola]|uniref:Cytochrome c family protein n=1 Tax=Desulfonema limicola TaxID=45656 RepID=A0A975BDZ7_9BACT|nr:cytochrome c family protein [Desulfonema limicola]QTA83525.1 Cytochrome c family protein [Desulfonema limicola]